MTTDTGQKDAQNAHIQTFFTGSAYNHAGATGSLDWPNWYYYYKDEHHPEASDMRGLIYWDQIHSRIKLTPPYELRIANDGYQSGGYLELPVFDTPLPSGFLRCVGHIKVKGILLYAWVAGHEIMHHELSTRNIYTWPVDAAGNIIGPPSSHGDDVNDDWEDNWKINNHAVLDSSKGDTSEGNAYLSTLDEPQDDEILADIGGLKMMLDQMSLWRKDWAAEAGTSNGGLQFGALAYDSDTNNTNHKKDFFLEFIPIVTPEQAPLPDNAQLIDGNYPIRDLTTLKRLYPRVITDVPY